MLIYLLSLLFHFYRFVSFSLASTGGGTVTVDQNWRVSNPFYEKQGEN